MLLGEHISSFFFDRMRGVWREGIEDFSRRDREVADLDADSIINGIGDGGRGGDQARFGHSLDAEGTESVLRFDKLVVR